MRRKSNGLPPSWQPVCALVEMAGIEPASEGFRLQASTSIVVRWFSPSEVRATEPADDQLLRP